MKKIIKTPLLILTVGIIAVAAHLFYLFTLSAKETYPEDNYLSTEKNKTALIIVAHDDDMAGSSATITKLCKEGWQIYEMCFYQQGGLYFKKDSAKNPIRKKSLATVASIQGLAGIKPIDFNFRNDMETEAPYLPMPYNKFAENFREDSLTIFIANFIQAYKPSVLFTLDDVIGGYGNPDHVIVSQLTKKYCIDHKNDTGFSVKKIYQSVFAPSLAENIMKDMPAYEQAKKVYQCNGMPLPDVQVTITSYTKEKKECMLAYTTEQNSFKQIWPYYNWYPSWIYFKIFDRDFFHIVDVKNAQ